MDITAFQINESATMIEAMEQLDRAAKRVLFVVRNGHLVAAITDGDIRRWILKNGNLNAAVKEIANYNPKYLLEGDQGQAKDFMKKYAIEALPIVDQEHNIIRLIFWNDEEVRTKRKLDVPIVIMAGGLGTRLYPYTKVLPKPLIPIGEVPIVEHIMNRFCEYGCDQFYLVVNHKKNMIKAYFSEIEKDYTVDYVDEDKPLGTGGGLSLLKGKIGKTFILTNCDILIKEDYSRILQFHQAEKNAITMVCSLKNFRIPYGIVDTNENGELESMREKPALTFFTNTGMYVVEAKIIEELEEGKAIGFPDIIEKHKQMGDKIGIYPINETNWLDMGQIDGMEEMQKRLENE